MKINLRPCKVLNKSETMESVNKSPSKDYNGFYQPQEDKKDIKRKKAQITKVKIVYNTSTKDNSSNSSLNDCLQTGKSLKNLIWDILVRSILLCEDTETAILQISIREK